MRSRHCVTALWNSLGFQVNIMSVCTVLTLRGQDDSRQFWTHGSARTSTHRHQLTSYIPASEYQSNCISNVKNSPVGFDIRVNPRFSRAEGQTACHCVSESESVLVSVFKDMPVKMCSSREMRTETTKGMKCHGADVRQTRQGKKGKNPILKLLSVSREVRLQPWQWTAEVPVCRLHHFSHN